MKVRFEIRSRLKISVQSLETFFPLISLFTTGQELDCRPYRRGVSITKEVAKWDGPTVSREPKENAGLDIYPVDPFMVRRTPPRTQNELDNDPVYLEVSRNSGTFFLI